MERLQYNGYATIEYKNNVDEKRSIIIETRTYSLETVLHMLKEDIAGIKRDMDKHFENLGEEINEIIITIRRT